MQLDQALSLAPMISGHRLDHLDPIEREAFDTLQAEGLADAVAWNPDDPDSTIEKVELIQPKQAQAETASDAFLEKMDANYAEDRATVAAALTGPEPDEAARLVRWMVEKDINYYGVFADDRFAQMMGNMEGITGLLSSIRNAIHDDGAICYPRTEAHGLYVCFLDRGEPNFQERFLDQIREQGHGDDVLVGHKVIGFADTIDDFMEAFDEAERNREEELQALFGLGNA
jgi:hypothetical protein